MYFFVSKSSVDFLTCSIFKSSDMFRPLDHISRHEVTQVSSKLQWASWPVVRESVMVGQDVPTRKTDAETLEQEFSGECLPSLQSDEARKMELNRQIFLLFSEGVEVNADVWNNILTDNIFLCDLSSFFPVIINGHLCCFLVCTAHANNAGCYLALTRIITVLFHRWQFRILINEFDEKPFTPCTALSASARRPAGCDVLSVMPLLIQLVFYNYTHLLNGKMTHFSSSVSSRTAV